MSRRRTPPPHLVEHARRFAASGVTPVEPRPAATVLLLREGADGPEVYLLRRAESMAFASGMYAYPGGSVDVRDGDTTAGWAGPTPEQWAARLGADVPFARALVCAAVRETFEESGVLLAGPSEEEVIADVRGDDWEKQRVALEAHEQSLSGLLERYALVLRTDLLGAWGRWITPEPEPRRYDTRFFVAALPEGQATQDVSSEADRVVWARPGRVLDAFERGEIQMLPPTYVTLEEIGAYDTVAGILASADQRSLEPITPRIVLAEDGARIDLPGDR